MGKTYTVDAKAYDEMARTTVEMLRVHADLKCKYYEMMIHLADREAALLAANERAAFAESREVCTMPHDGDVTTCGYCQRDALQESVNTGIINDAKRFEWLAIDADRSSSLINDCYSDWDADPDTWPIVLRECIDMAIATGKWP
jgi:hypothetical protein